MKFIAILPFIILGFLASAQTTGSKKGGGSYFTNPIFKGDYPDPSILRDG
jgi:xylan 1,4-beta-xylosidase